MSFYDVRKWLEPKWADQLSLLISKPIYEARLEQVTFCCKCVATTNGGGGLALCKCMSTICR